MRNRPGMIMQAHLVMRLQLMILMIIAGTERYLFPVAVAVAGLIFPSVIPLLSATR